MKLLVIGTDRNIFLEKSAIRERISAYQSMFEEVHIIVFSLRLHGFVDRVSIAPNIWAYPTCSWSRFLYIFDAIRIGKNLFINNYKLKAKNCVVSAQDPFETGLAAWRVAHAHNVPLQLQLHTNPFSPYFRGVINWMRKRIAKYIIPKAQCIRVVRPALKQEIVERELTDAERVHVVPLPVVLPDMIDPERAREKCTTLLPGVSRRIACVGRLASEKRYSDALSVLARIREVGIDAGLIFFGDGMLLRALKKRAAALGISDYVAFPGHVENVHEYIAGSDVFLHTSQFEGYGLVLIEAAALGIPVVTTRVGVAEDVFTHRESAYICEVGDIECLTRGVSDILENPGGYADMIAQGSHIARQSAWSREEYLHGFKKSLESCINA